MEVLHLWVEFALFLFFRIRDSPVVGFMFVKLRIFAYSYTFEIIDLVLLAVSIYPLFSIFCKKVSIWIESISDIGMYPNSSMHLFKRCAVVTIVLSDKSSCICSQSKAISLNNLELFDLYFGFLPFLTINR